MGGQWWEKEPKNVIALAKVGKVVGVISETNVTSEISCIGIGKHTNRSEF